MADIDYTALAAQFGGTPSGTPPKPIAGPGRGGRVMDYTALAKQFGGEPVQTSGDDGGGIVSGFVQNSPIGVVQGAADFLRHPIDTISNVTHQNAALLDKAKEAHAKGDNSAALFHLLNYFIPGGAALDDAGEDFQSGNVARGTAKTLGLASTMVSGAKAPAVLDAATEPSNSPTSIGKTVARKLAVKIAAKSSGVPGAEHVINAVIDALEPEGETAGPVLRPSTSHLPALRDRPPLRVEVSEPPPPADVVPIPSELPSGRVPGGIQNQSSPVATPAPPPPAVDVDLLNEISQSQAGKPFARLTPQGQATVKMLAAHVVEDAPVTQPPPVVSQPAPEISTPAPISGPAAAVVDHAANAAGLPPAPRIVDGLKVRSSVPDLQSITSSLEDAEELPGIREVKFSDFPGHEPRKGKLTSYSATEQQRTKFLAEQIMGNKEINPLIVVYDKDGPYILEGGHRFDALDYLGHKSFPAKVVIDRGSLGYPEETGATQTPEVATPLSKADLAKRALAEEMLKSGSATPEMMTDPAAAVPVVPDAAALKTLMRDLPPGGPRAIANANYAANQEPAQAAAVYEAAGRAAKSQALSQMLYDEGLTSRQVARWSQKAWESAAGDRGMPTAFSKESQGEVIAMLRKLEKTVPK